MVKRFLDFILRTFLKENDYIVGYDGDTGEEIRILAGNVAQKGEAGASAEIQFSKNTANWHFPATEDDVYVRFRVGAGAWSVSRFVGRDAENNSALPIGGQPYDTLILDTNGNPLWLRGILEITPTSPEVKIDAFATKTVIDYRQNADLILNIENIFENQQTATIIIYNNRAEELTVIIQGIDIEWRCDMDFFSIAAGKTGEISLMPYKINGEIKVNGIRG